MECWRYWPKVLELRNLLINSVIDVLAVQELKLWKADKTPFIEGYTTVRKDWNNILEGRLLLFIPTDIVFGKLHSFKKTGMEVLSIRLKTTKSTWLECILADLLYYIAETKNLFSRPQDGLSKGRSCEGQITGKVQAIEDGFQQRPMQRSVLTLLDFSKTYNTVWSEKLPQSTCSTF